MPRIRVLPPEVTVRIAAGEVIERPASVVKELCDNAVDAGARRVVVEIEGGGLERIAVTDDGCGMDREDAELCLLRHATSKLAAAEDLESVATLGFRGEALASIAAVAQVTVTTRVADEAEGTRVQSTPGTPPAISVVAAAPGTTVEVRALFANVPARRRVLEQRSRAAEGAAVEEVVAAEALARPDIAFRLVIDGRLTLQTSGAGSLRAAAADLWGAEMAQALLSIDEVHEGWRLTGWVSPPALHRGNRQAQFVGVNGRPVRLLWVTQAVEAAYRNLLMVHRYPLFALHLEGPRAELDVNVHPSKREVRIRSEATVRALCHQAVRRALLLGAQPATWGERPAVAAGGEIAVAATAESTDQGSSGWYALEQAVPPVASEPTSAQLPPMRLIGQFARSFLLAEGDGELFIVDQHAAHERVYYEQLAEPRPRPAQLLAFPVLVDLNETRWRLWEQAASALAAQGFTVEPFGERSLVVRAVPGSWSDFTAAALLELLDRWQRDSHSDPEERARVATAACKAAVKAGQLLTAEDGAALLSALRHCREPWTCPHGRPTVLRLDQDELARHFGRHN